MALQGTIKDFALPDIFQLIGLQKKTGILTLDGGEETVTLKFLVGEVVGADTSSRSLEDRLGEVLVRTQKITPQHLRDALDAQSTTLQRLGHILVNTGHISDDELMDALRIQSCQIIYRLFRWNDAEYSFDAVEDLEYDQKHFTPIGAETILMEGARMIDEWPIIERRIKSPEMVLRRTAAADALDLTVSESESSLEDDLDFDLGFDLDQPEPEPDEPKDEDEITLSPEEREVLTLVDAKRSVGEICDLLAMGEFDTYRLLADLMTRHLVEEVERGRQPVVETRGGKLLDRSVAWIGLAAVALGVAATLATLSINSFTPWRVLAAQPATEQLKQYTSLTRLEKITHAVQVFYLDSGTLPRSLAVLSQAGFVRPADLLDPWGRAYYFELSAGGYQLYGFDGDGQPDPGLTFSRHLTPVQRMLLEGGDSIEP